MGFFDRFKKKTPLHLYSEDALNQYEAYITEQFGPYTEVFHEIVFSRHSFGYRRSCAYCKNPVLPTDHHGHGGL